MDESDVEMLRAKIKSIKEAMKEYQGKELWKTNKYEELLSKLEALERRSEGNVKVTANGYTSSGSTEETVENRKELFEWWMHQKTSYGQLMSLVLVLNSLLFIGYAQIFDTWFGVVVACVGVFNISVNLGFLIIERRHVNNLQQRLNITEYERRSKISRILPWNALAIFSFLAPIWVSGVIFSATHVW